MPEEATSRTRWAAVNKIAALMVVIATLIGATPARALYPERTITVIVPNEAGGPLDIIARIVVKNLQKSVTQKIIVRNIVGGGTAIGDRAAHDAAPDGYTLLVIHQAFLIASAEGTLGFDYRDMTPIARAAGQSLMLTASSAAPYKNFADFVTHARANPGQDRIGVFLTAHNHAVSLAMMQATQTKLKLINIPGGGAPLIPALLSGQLDVALMGPSDVEPYVRSGKMVPLALLGDSRPSKLPDVPTAAELGYPQLNMNVTSFWWMRHDVPEDIRTFWGNRLEAVFKDPEAIKEIRQETDDTGFTRGAETQREVAAEFAKFDALVRENGLKRQ